LSWSASICENKSESERRVRSLSRPCRACHPADLIAKQRLDQRNRIALILLDSTLEIAFKEYLVNESGVVYNDQKLLSLFANRTAVQNEIKKYVNIKPETWKKIDHYYRLRCKLVHERATVGISDQQLQDFRDVVERVLRKLYKLKFTKE
jgi:hypothetical protein